MLENYPEDIDLSPDNDDDEYLTKIIVDTCARKFIIWSNAMEYKNDQRLDWRLSCKSGGISVTI